MCELCDAPKHQIDPLAFWIAVICFVIGLVGFILSWIGEPDAINMGLGSSIAGIFFLIIGRAVR